MSAGSGFLIRYEGVGRGNEGASEEETLAFGVKGNIYYTLIDGTEAYYDLSAEAYAVVYVKNAGEERAVWTKEINYYNEQYTRESAKTEVNATITAASAWMTYYGINASGEGMKMSKATVAGRNCDKQYNRRYGRRCP